MIPLVATTGASLGDNLVALGLMVVVVAYLFLVLILPERF